MWNYSRNIVIIIYKTLMIFTGRTNSCDNIIPKCPVIELTLVLDVVPSKG